MLTNSFHAQHHMENSISKYRKMTLGHLPSYLQFSVIKSRLEVRSSCYYSIINTLVRSLVFSSYIRHCNTEAKNICILKLLLPTINKRVVKQYIILSLRYCIQSSRHTAACIPSITIIIYQ